MKIPKSVRELYKAMNPIYEKLKINVDALMRSRCESKWHYESRIKTEVSFALKLETGRELDPSRPDDFFGATIVVENRNRVTQAEELVTTLFKQVKRKPKLRNETHLPPHSFDFDELRLYVEWKDDPSNRPTGLSGLLFEFQVKTFLQHAWGIATHDTIYKSYEVNWAASRIAFQVKAMLENAEMSIAEARRISSIVGFDRSDRMTREIQSTIFAIKDRWEIDQLPDDLRRLAQNFEELRRKFSLSSDELWSALDDATEKGNGAKTLNLSPYTALLEAIVSKHGTRVFERLNTRDRIFVPSEVELGELTDKAKSKLVRPIV